MKVANLVTLILIIIGGLDLGILGLANVDLLTTTFGGAGAMLTRIVFVILGLSALWQLIPLGRAFGSGEVTAERNVG